ncbi:MAG: hypothetical protein IPH13_07420 [Planctomycetes bacterium]|nr:hypothetical protein [Planctomycetota bacterium]
MSEPAKRPDCARCEHFIVTWNPAAPRGCKAYGFKGKDYPSVVVLRETGMPCQLFQDKPLRPPTSSTS